MSYARPRNTTGIGGRHEETTTMEIECRFGDHSVVQVSDELEGSLVKQHSLCRPRMLPAFVIAFSLATATASAQEHVSPVRMDPDKMAGVGLEPGSSAMFADILVEGELQVKRAILFDGTELRVSMFESTPGKTDHRDVPFDFDEFVYVLSGKLILTEPDGTVHEYTPGDAVVVPIGYRGTWEMQGNYRELVVLMKDPE